MFDEVSEFMSTREISNALWDVKAICETLSIACGNRLQELGYNEDTYEEGSNNEIECLLVVREQLDDFTE